jgi:uncharacterized protein YbjT (DUF2867 family)
MTTRGVLVVGATGTQGGAVTERLLESSRGYDVSALTRDPHSTTALQLGDRGVTVTEGDLWEPDSLATAMESVDAVFAMTDFWEAGYDAEVTQGTNLVNAAAQSDVEQFVFSSALGAGHATGVPMLESKAGIEAQVDRLDCQTTVIRPSYLMQNFELRRDDIEDGTLALPLAPGTRLPIADATDLGRLVDMVLSNPDRYTDTTVPLAGDELTLREMAAAFAEALGQDVNPVHLPIDIARSEGGDAYANLFEWYNQSVPGGIVGHLRSQFEVTPNSLAE